MKPTLRALPFVWAAFAGVDMAAAAPVGTAITYQGFLSDGVAPAAGQYDLQFKLMTAETGPGQSGSTIERDNVIVNAGRFAVELDFGPGYLSSQSYWLEIGVRPGNQAGAYTLLSPRSKLTPAPYALNLAMPFYATDSSPSALLGLTQMSSGPVIQGINQGTGTGIQGNILNAANGSPGVAGTTNGSGNAIFGHTSGSGRAAFFQINNAASSAAAVEATTNGLGRAASFTNTNVNHTAPVLEASTSGKGAPASFKIVNAGSDAAAVYGQTNGSGAAVQGVNLNTTGVAGEFSNTHAQSPNPALSAVNSGTGSGVYAKSSKGRAAFFENTSASNTADVMRAHNVGNGAAVFGFSTGSGAGVRGGSDGSGAAVMAVANTTGTAINIGGGALRVQGAGVGSPTTVFVHYATSSNTVGHVTAIDNPICNGDPYAILIVTSRLSLPGYSVGSFNDSPLSVSFDSINYNPGRWLILNLTNNDIELPALFNVLVVKP
jgi:hypothetical protein